MPQHSVYFLKQLIFILCCRICNLHTVYYLMLSEKFFHAKHECFRFNAYFNGKICGLQKVMYRTKYARNAFIEYKFQ